MNWKKWICVTLLLCLALAQPVGARAVDTTVLTCWVYYQGAQAQEFDRLLQEFNDTVGLEKGIYVEAHSMGGVNDLAERLVASARKEVGAEAMPDLFSSYADTGYQLLQMGIVADLTPYLSDDDLSKYVSSYVEEGRLGTQDGFYIFPAAKSTELLLLNRTAWDVFASETGADESLLDTWEGLVELGRAYFEWSDAMTPEQEGDGKAFFGRDAMANYVLTGSYQLGSEIFQVENGEATICLDRDAMRRLWDCFYVPFVSGWYAANGRFRSDDIRTGQIVALVGSTSGALYFPSQVTSDDGTSYDIECSVHLLPNFEGTSPVATQQGAGFMVTKSTPRIEEAAVTFLKWFTEPERNIGFSLKSGYLPVTREANTPEKLNAAIDEAGSSEMIRNIITTGSQIITSYQLYTNKPFRNGAAARAVVNDTLFEAAVTALEERRQLQTDGTAYADAVAAVTTDEHFEAWYNATLEALEESLALQ